MSRRAPNPAAERAAQNTQTLKSLVKLEGNKTCADCKRNKRKLDSTSATLFRSATNPFLPQQIQDGQVGIWAYSSA